MTFRTYRLKNPEINVGTASVKELIDALMDCHTCVAVEYPETQAGTHKALELIPKIEGALDVFGASQIASAACQHCGMHHVGRCPRVKAIEYFPDGAVKRVEYHPPPQLSLRDFSELVNDKDSWRERL